MGQRGDMYIEPLYRTACAKSGHGYNYFSQSTSAVSMDMCKLNFLHYDLCHSGPVLHKRTYSTKVFSMEMFPTKRRTVRHVFVQDVHEYTFRRTG